MSSYNISGLPHAASRLIDPSDLRAINSLKQPDVLRVPTEGLFFGVSDGITALALPIIAYWTYSTMFHLLDVYKLFEAHRIHPSEEMLSKNRATVYEVVRDVIFQHIIQTVMGLVAFSVDSVQYTGFENAQMWSVRQSVPDVVPTWLIYVVYWYGISVVKMSVAFLMIDTWQFVLHRFMHQHIWFYKHFHSRHHQLYVPYAYGALFNHPLEGLMLDTVGTGLSSILLGLTPRECTFLYTFATMKTVDDHCGYSIPFDPFQRLFPNNSIYHDIHHQHFGIKYNYSQPFFTFWDTLFGSTYTQIDEYRDKDNKITLEGYHRFLSERKSKRRMLAQEVHKTFKDVSGSEDEDDSPENPVNIKKNI